MWGVMCLGVGESTHTEMEEARKEECQADREERKGEKEAADAAVRACCRQSLSIISLHHICLCSD